MSADFDDVLTNQPVVIDNVRHKVAECMTFQLASYLQYRVLVPSKLGLLVKSTLNVIFHPCTRVSCGYS